MKSNLTYRIKPTADMCRFHGINEETQFETRFADGEIVVKALDQNELEKQYCKALKKIGNECLECVYFCEACGRCSIINDTAEEAPSRCKGCPDFCKEKGICMRGEDI